MNNFEFLATEAVKGFLESELSDWGNWQWGNFEAADLGDGVCSVRVDLSISPTSQVTATIPFEVSKNEKGDLQIKVQCTEDGEYSLVEHHTWYVRHFWLALLSRVSNL